MLRGLRFAISTLCVGAAAVCGCLFPSFDELRGSGASASEDDGGGAGTTSSSSGAAGTSGGTSGGTSSSSSSSSSSGGIAGDAGGDAGGGDTGAPVPQKIQCGGGLACEAATTFCCAKISGGNECRPRGGATAGCNSVLACDGPEDCPTGQSCCQNAFGGANTVCKAGGCQEGYTFCNPAIPGTCPPGEPSCSGDSIGIFGAEPTSCE